MTLVQPWGMVYTRAAVQAKNPGLTPGQDSKACCHLFPPSRKNKSYNCEVGWKMLKTGNNGGPTITRSLPLIRRKNGFLLYNKLPYRLLAAQPKHCLLSDYHNRKWNLTLKGSERCHFTIQVSQLKYVLFWTSWKEQGDQSNILCINI